MGAPPPRRRRRRRAVRASPPRGPRARGRRLAPAGRSGPAAARRGARRRPGRSCAPLPRPGRPRAHAGGVAPARPTPPNVAGAPRPFVEGGAGDRRRCHPVAVLSRPSWRSRSSSPAWPPARSPPRRRPRRGGARPWRRARAAASPTCGSRRSPTATRSGCAWGAAPGTSASPASTRWSCTRYSEPPLPPTGARAPAIEAAAVVDRLGARGPLARAPASPARELVVRAPDAPVGVGPASAAGGVDVGAPQVIARGLALWLPNSAEWAHDREYHGLAEAARAAGDEPLGPDRMRHGPGAGRPPPSCATKYDAERERRREPRRRVSRPPQPGRARRERLAGWWLRDVPTCASAGGARRASASRPGPPCRPAARSCSTAAAGATTGTTCTGARRHRCSTTSPPDARAFGDGAYLFDPQGDLRPAPPGRACAPARTRCRAASGSRCTRGRPSRSR